MTYKAVFFDRDGVLVKPVYHDKTGKYGAPWTLNELQLYDIDQLKKLEGYRLFLISNQPDAGKGNTKVIDLLKINTKFQNILMSNGIYFSESYYCLHTKNDNCICRKPSPYFLIKAANDYCLNLKESWMLGDRDTDIECGKNAGVKTIKIIEDIDAGTNNLEDAIEMILNENIP